MSEEKAEEPQFTRPAGTKIYQFTTATWSTGDQSWWAVSEEGEILISHISSSSGWGMIDTGDQGMHKDKYERFAEGYELVPLDPGEFPPDEVLLKAGFEWRR